jgi:hypothetical protein
MAFDPLLTEKKDGIVQRWIDQALKIYDEDAEMLFGTEEDPFANPVGASLRQGTGDAFGALLAGEDAAAVSGHLSEIIKIRAVQQFPASEGLAFILQLKDVARSVMAEDAAGPAAVDWTGFDRRIDEVTLASFDLYSEYRHQVYELRVNEAKRSVSWVLEKMGERDDCAEPDEPEGSDDLNER